jgi:nucleotide-binding universal stress UspA family protein
MMTVVVGVDGLPESVHAIRLAKQEADYRGVGLTAVMAYTSESSLGTPAVRPISVPGTPDEQRASAESVLRQAVVDALGAVDGVELEVVAGGPGRVLVQVARTLDAEMVVLSTRKEHAPSRLLGAVSQHVLRNAPCPVLVVPEPDKEP